MLTVGDGPVALAVERIGWERNPGGTAARENRSPIDGDPVHPGLTQRCQEATRTTIAPPQRCHHPSLFAPALQILDRLGDRQREDGMWAHLYEQAEAVIEQATNRRLELYLLTHVAVPILSVECLRLQALGCHGRVKGNLAGSRRDLRVRLHELLAQRLHMTRVTGCERSGDLARTHSLRRAYRHQLLDRLRLT